MCVLLVEDEPLIRLILTEVLEEAGFEVRAAEDGVRAAALIEARSDDFVLLVTDIHVPGGADGIEVARLLRARRPSIPVVYATGRPDVLATLGPLGRREALMPKPFAPSELVATVRRLLGDGHDAGRGG